MNIRWNPFPPTEPAEEMLSFNDDGRRVSRTAAVAAAMFGFLCFMPYPALGVGNNSAIQLGNIATLIALLCMSLGELEGLSIAFIFLIAGPRCISTLKVLLIDGANASVCFNETASWILTLLTILATRVYAPRHALSILTGIALATLVHAAVGAYQMYSFTSGVFPLLNLYVNPSFLSVQENAVRLARWEQRPFGIFPEPSAMSSSLGPFVIFFAAVCFDLVRLRVSPAVWQRHLFAAAAAGGMGLIIVSKSGHAAPTLAAIGLLLVMWLRRARATLGTYMLVAIVLGAVMPLVLIFTYNAMSTRVASGVAMGNDSWEERFTSLVIGFKAWSGRGIATAVFGLGPGLSSQVVKDVSGIDSVFSLLLSYLYETGLLGLAVAGWVGQRICRTWRIAWLSPVYGAILVNWIIGVTLTTSYAQLLPLWIALGWLIAWNDICETTAAQPVEPAAAVSIRLPSQRQRHSPWSAASVAPASRAG